MLLPSAGGSKGQLQPSPVSAGWSVVPLLPLLEGPWGPSSLCLPPLKGPRAPSGRRRLQCHHLQLSQHRLQLLHLVLSRLVLPLLVLQLLRHRLIYVQGLNFIGHFPGHRLDVIAIVGGLWTCLVAAAAFCAVGPLNCSGLDRCAAGLLVCLLSCFHVATAFRVVGLLNIFSLGSPCCCPPGRPPELCFERFQCH